mgnify:CR=1 FL=1
MTYGPDDPEGQAAFRDLAGAFLKFDGISDEPLDDPSEAGAFFMGRIAPMMINHFQVVDETS